MSDEPEISASESKSNVSTLVIIYGVTAFLVSGMCTGNIASQTMDSSSTDIYGPSTIWEAITFGAFGFVPAALFIFLGWWVSKRGHNIWIDLLLLLLAIYMLIVIIFSFFMSSVF